MNRLKVPCLALVVLFVGGPLAFADEAESALAIVRGSLAQEQSSDSQTAADSSKEVLIGRAAQLVSSAVDRISDDTSTKAVEVSTPSAQAQVAEEVVNGLAEEEK